MNKIEFKNIAPKKSSDERDLIELVSELNDLIPDFVESTIFKRDIFDKSDENHYTETLIKYFENERINSRFSFKPQASLPNNRSIDIGVHLKANSEHYIFGIEAKFLPPTDYVTGEYAAIKRFRKGQHGLSNRNPAKAKNLQENAIVGYSKSGTFEKHLITVNRKIIALAKVKLPDNFGLIWDVTEQLHKIKFDSIAILQSVHTRQNGSKFKLHHFWVYV